MSNERASKLVRDIGAVYALHRIHKYPERKDTVMRFMAVIMLILCVLLMFAAFEIRQLRSVTDQPPVVVNCAMVVKMPDAERPGWYCIPEGQEG